MARLLVRREAEDDHHFNVSSPTPEPLQNSGTTPGADTGGNSTIYIVTGVVVPLVLIGIGALIAYYCYRKKYPVRMVMGKDFAKFSNPAYNKRTSTLTLVREDAENYWDTFQPSGIQNPGLTSMLEDEEDPYQDSVRAEVVDETGASVKMEDIEKMIAGGDSVILHGTQEDGEEDTVDEHENGDNPERTDMDDTKQDEAKPVKPPRKRAMLIKDDDLDNLDDGFEIVSESDLAGRSDTETSSVNDSTGTHTIALSTAEHTEASETSDGSIHDINEKDIDSEKISLDKATISTSDGTDDEQSDIEKGQRNEANDTNSNGYSENNETSQEAGIGVLNDETKTETSVHLKRNEEELDSKHSDSSSTDSLEHFETIEAALNNDPDNSLDNIEFAPKVKTGLKLTLSSEKMYLEAPTPTPIVVPDSIIFESESSSPVHLDDAKDASPRRQRRAHTIECVMGSLHDGKEKELAVKKDWYSNDDIENMGNAKAGIELFQPIHKRFSIGSPSSSEEESQEGDIPFKETTVTPEEELQKQPEMNMKVESQTTNELSVENDQLITGITQTDDEVLSNTAHAASTDKDTSDKKDLLHQTNSSNDDVNSGLSLSFELVDKDDPFDKSFETVGRENTDDLDNNYAPFPATNDAPTTRVQEHITPESQQDSSQVTHADDNDIRQEENTDSSSEESNDQSIEIISKVIDNAVFDNTSVFANVALPDVLSETGFEGKSTGEQDAKHSFSNSNDFFTTVPNETHTHAPEIDESFALILEANAPESQQQAPELKDESSKINTTDNPFTDLPTDMGISQILDMNDTSEFVIPEMHKKEETDQDVQKETTNLSLLVDFPEMGAEKDHNESDVNSAGSFQQFETSLLGASTPTSMAVNDPLANLKTGLVEFDDDLKNISSTNSDSFDSFNLTEVTQSLDKSFEEDSSKRLTTESSSTYSFEVISEDSNKTSPTTLQEKKRISVSIENLILSSDSGDDDDDDDDTTTDDDEDDEDATSYNSGDFPNLMLDLDRSKQESSTDTPKLQSVPEVTQTWDVLDEDTEA